MMWRKLGLARSPTWTLRTGPSANRSRNRHHPQPCRMPIRMQRAISHRISNPHRKQIKVGKRDAVRRKRESILFRQVFSPCASSLFSSRVDPHSECAYEPSRFTLKKTTFSLSSYPNVGRDLSSKVELTYFNKEETVMDPTTRAIRLIITAFVAIGIIFVIFFAIKVLILPKLQADLVTQTSSETKFKTNVRIGLDSFAGYAVIRSPNFRDQLGRSEIGVRTIDDKANYPDRMKALAKGELDIAVFTIDTNIAAGADFDIFPGAITLIIDESHGADGGVAYKQAVPNVSALNRRDAKIVATADSPSETLARHLIANMLPALASEDWLVAAKDADDVLDRLKKANKSDPAVYFLWEPALSKALALPDVILVYDTSKVSGTIVDVLVVNRKFLIEQPKVVRSVEEAYFRALH